MCGDLRCHRLKVSHDNSKCLLHPRFPVVLATDYVSSGQHYPWLIPLHNYKYKLSQ